jgi:hypothetical protein
MHVAAAACVGSRRLMVLATKQGIAATYDDNGTGFG